MEKHEFALIPISFRKQDINWIRLSPDVENTGGTYLLLYKDLSEKSLYDYWFENLEKAKAWGEKYFGVKLKDWRTRENLEKNGIKIIDEK